MLFSFEKPGAPAIMRPVLLYIKHDEEANANTNTNTEKKQDHVLLPTKHEQNALHTYFMNPLTFSTFPVFFWNYIFPLKVV